MKGNEKKKASEYHTTSTRSDEPAITTWESYGRDINIPVLGITIDVRLGWVVGVGTHRNGGVKSRSLCGIE